MPKVSTRLPTNADKLSPFTKDLFDLLEAAMMFNIDRRYSRPSTLEIQSLSGSSSRIAKFGIVRRLLMFDLQEKFLELVHKRTEMDQLQGLLDDVRPVKLSGLTGTGKTVCLRIGIDEWRQSVAEQKGKSVAIVVDVKGRVSGLGHSIDDKSYTSGDLSHHVNALIIANLFTEQGPEVAKRLFDYVWEVSRPVALNVGIDPSVKKVPQDINPDTWAAFVERLKDSKLQATQLLGVLKRSGYRVCMAFDNVDRLSYPVQRLLYTVAIDYSNEVEMPVVFACRGRKLKRSPETGANGDVVHEVHLSSGYGIDDAETQWLFDSVLQQGAPTETVHLSDDQFIDLILRRTGFVLERPYVQDYLASEHPNQVFHNKVGELDVIEQRERLVLNQAISIWTGTFKVLTYFNGGIRETANMLTAALFRLLLEVDHGFEYTSLFARTYLSVPQVKGRIVSHFMGCLCTGSEATPSSLKIHNVFACTSKGFLASASTALYGLQRNWNVEEFSVGDLARMWAQFGLDESDTRTVVSDLAQSRWNGSHGFLMGPSLEFDAFELPKGEESLLLLPSSSVFFGIYIYKVEYLFWSLLYKEWTEAEFTVLSRIHFLSKVQGETVIRLDDKVRYVIGALELLYEGEFHREVERLDAASPGWRGSRWLGPYVFKKMVESFLGFVTELSQEGIEGVGNRASQLVDRIVGDLDGAKPTATVSSS